MGERSGSRPRDRDLVASIAAYPSLEGHQQTHLGRFRRARSRRLFGGTAGLLWLIPAVVDFAQSNPSTPALILTCAGLVAFVGLYVFGVFDRRVGGRTALGGLLAIATLLTLLADQNFATMFVYAAAAAGVRFGFAGLRVVAVCTVLAYGLPVLAGTGQDQALSYAAVTLSIGCMMLAFGRLIAVNLELEGARDELARLAVADERLRFARDLHDLLGHSLSVIALKAELAGRLLGRDTATAATHLGEIEGVARDALAEVREAVSGYRRPVLSAELDGARAALRTAGIEMRLDGAEQPLSPEVEALLAWALREATTNVIRHSGARHCHVRLAPSDGGGSIEVTDDGRGPNGRGEEIGHGLIGLRERAERLQGRLEAGPGPDGGFRLRVSVPATGPAI